MHCPRLAVLVFAVACLLAGCCSDDGPPPLGGYSGTRIAFYSYRPGVGGSTRDVYLYDRNRASLVDLPNLNTAGYEGHPSISANGAQIPFTSDRAGSSGSFDLYEYWPYLGSVTTPPGLNGSGMEFDAQITRDASYIAFASDETGTWDIYLYEYGAAARVPLPALNTSIDDEEMPGISDDANYIVFQSNRVPADAGGVDVYLFDRDAIGLVNMPGLNSSSDERNPCISGDGRYIAFDADRAGGAGNRDVYVYDLETSALVAPSPWNSSADDYWPHFNADGSLMTFSSYRSGGVGDADIYLYNLEDGAFIDLPGLNSPQTDHDASMN